jgi:Cu/Ag efflux protein CusF
MRWLVTPAAFAALQLLVTQARPQAPAAKLDRIIGEVTAIDANAKQISVKSDAGTVMPAMLDDKTVYLRIPPGEKDLKKAANITLQDVAVGDRAFVRGHMAEDQKSIAAVAVIIMTKAELAQKHERDREEWKQRGLAGPVTALNSETKEITISTRTREGPKPVVVEAAEKADFRRYAPDSVRFSDAKPGSFTDLKVGDQMRVLGEKSADGARIKAEAIVSGSFRNIAGVIKTMDASANEITLTDLVAHKPVTIHITPETGLRRLPAWMAAMLARREGGAPGGAAAPGGGPGARPGPANAEGIPGPPRPDAPKPGSGGQPAERAGIPNGGGMRRGNMDFQDMLERMPPLKLAELKTGDAIMLSATNGADSGRVTAINVLAGVEPLLTAAPQGGQQIFGTWNFDIGLPQ